MNFGIIVRGKAVRHSDDSKQLSRRHVAYNKRVDKVADTEILKMSVLWYFSPGRASIMQPG